MTEKIKNFTLGGYGVCKDENNILFNFIFLLFFIFFCIFIIYDVKKQNNENDKIIQIYKKQVNKEQKINLSLICGKSISCWDKKVGYKINK